jgi:hypothetical protein
VPDADKACTQIIDPALVLIYVSLPSQSGQISKGLAPSNAIEGNVSLDVQVFEIEA